MASRIRWGILGTGRVCSDFMCALKIINANVTAVAASSKIKAEVFASQHGIGQSFGSYEELSRSADVDVIYIGTIHPLHKQHALLCFKNKKHVLVEKPIALNYNDAKEMVDAARSAGLFFMEGMWTRFFPAVRAARAAIARGDIGTVKLVQADFGFEADPDDSSIARLYDPAIGGGALLDIGVYPLAAATLAYGGQAPTHIAAVGNVFRTGVDVTASISLKFGDKGVASVAYSVETETPEETTYIGTKGSIRLHTPAHCPTSVTINKFTDQRGVTQKEELSFPLPARLSGAPDLIFPNSEGFAYQAEAVETCIRNGQTESAEFPLDESLVLMQITDHVRQQLGVKYPNE